MKRLLFSLLGVAFVIALFSGATAINPFAMSSIEREILLGLRLPRVLFFSGNRRHACPLGECLPTYVEKPPRR